MAAIMSPRLVRLAAPFAIRPTVSTRVFISRYSTAADEDVIKTSQVPAPGSGHVRVLQLNRPKARNAISRHLLDTLSKQVNAIAAEGGNGPTRALVVASSADAAFCAGADLKERAGMTMAEYEARLHAGVIPATYIAHR
jgi:methylglutaconyl-CoA hydratase